MKTKLLANLFVLLGCLSCGSSTDALIGEWVKNNYDHRFFNADGSYREVYINATTGAIDTFDLRGSYKVLGSTLVFSIRENVHDPATSVTNPTNTVRFEQTGPTTLVLTFQDGTTGTYIKK